MNSCYNCVKREVGCHSYCLDYKEYKEKLETTNENRKIESGIVTGKQIGRAHV